MAFAGGAGVVTTPWVATLGVGVYFALGANRRQRLLTYGSGVLLAYVAVYAGFILFLATGCQSDNGHVDSWMWAIGLSVIAAGAAWALRRPRRTVWGLPLATFTGFVVMAVLALVVNGSTGWCPD